MALHRAGFFLLLCGTLPVWGQPVSQNAQKQISALLAEKAARTPAQQKIDSNLFHASRIVRGIPVHPDLPVPPGALEAVRRDARDFVEVDIRAEVTPALLTFIRSAGGTVVNAFAEYKSVRARVPLTGVEQLAERAEVQEISPADFGHGNAGPDVSGDVAHQAITARASFGLDGTGVKVGVMSDGVNSLAIEQAAGRLPAVVNVIPNQQGNGDEGTAMLEIVTTLAPGATLYYATAQGGQANMANNIQALANAGCKIIIDDWTYFAEGVFQDDIIARKVNAVADAGVFYFSDAQNSGSVRKGNSGTWEGDFLDSGQALPQIPALQATGGAMHNFGTASNVISSEVITQVTPPGPGFIGGYYLKWSDPLNASNNDYDLFILDSGLTTVLASSTNVQRGTTSAIESIGSNSNVTAGSRIVVIRHPGATTRALHLDTERGRISNGTTGATFGHNAAAGAFTLAAADVVYAAGGAYKGGNANPGYFYSSDGPRRMFFNLDGSAITPGNVLFGTQGGTVLNKPEFTAADGVTTGVSGFTSFYGTSAAGPHAGAIAALMLQARPTLTRAGMLAAFDASALDIEASGFDVNSGAGIVMAPAAVSAVLATSGLTISESHTGSFNPGQTDAAYTITVANSAGSAVANGTVTVTEVPPAGLTITSMSGIGWNCAALMCTRGDALAGGAAYPAIAVGASVSTTTLGQLVNAVSLAYGGTVLARVQDAATIQAQPSPLINPAGVVPLYNLSTTIQAGSWATIYGANLAPGTALWTGDYPLSLGNVSVTINGKKAFLAYVSPGQINMQTPDDTASGPVTVTVTQPSGSGSGTITLADVSPSLNLFTLKYPAAVILTAAGYDLAGPTGAFGASTRPVKAGEIVLLFGTGFGPTNPGTHAGQAFSGAPPTVNGVGITLGGTPVTPIYAVTNAPGAYQIAFTAPEVASGDQALDLTVAGAHIQSGVVLTMQ